MKQKAIIQSGFTLIEVLIVISITALLMAAITINFNRTRAARSVVFAQNETVTNIRKVQSYMLSSRDITPSVPAKFYYIKFQKGLPTYTIGAIDNNYNLHENLETVTLPGGVVISSLRYGDGAVSIDRCVEILFSAPFGKMFLNKDKQCDDDLISIVQNPVTLYEMHNQVVEIVLTPTHNAPSNSIDVYSLTGRIDANPGVNFEASDEEKDG